MLVLALSACGGSDATSAEQADDAAVGVDAPVDGRDAAQEADDGSGGDEASGGDAAGAGDGGEDAAADGGAEDLAPDGAGEGAVTTVAGGGQGRRVVTSSIDVAVEDVPAAARRVRDAALVAGGFVSGESTTGGEHPRAEITLRVPVAAGPDLLTAVAALGEEVARSADSQDVEATLVDLESRTATQRAGVERIRALLQQATSLDDVLALEAELTRRQSDLESVQSQREALAERAALATVTVVLTRPDDVLAVAPAPPFLTGLASGWEALTASTAVVLVVVGALLPFAVLAMVLGAVLLGTLRALRARRAGVPAVAGPDSGA